MKSLFVALPSMVIQDIELPQEYSNKLKAELSRIQNTEIDTVIMGWMPTTWGFIPSITLLEITLGHGAAGRKKKQLDKLSEWNKICSFLIGEANVLCKGALAVPSSHEGTELVLEAKERGVPVLYLENLVHPDKFACELAKLYSSTEIQRVLPSGPVDAIAQFFKSANTKSS